MLEKCDVNNDTSFCCRAFLVRYRDEIHELNDAVHWRLTIPKVIFISYSYYNNVIQYIVFELLIIIIYYTILY